MMLAPGEVNTLELGRPLLLMKARANAIHFKLPFGIHRVHVPSDYGGRLTIGLGLSPKPKLVDDWRSKVDLKILDPKGDLHELRKPDDSLTFDLRPGGREHGDYWAIVQAPEGAYWLYATFIDQGHARRADGSPLIPWNFWYFPFSEKLKGADLTAWAGTKYQPFQKYEQAFDTWGALEWEKKHHSDLHDDRKAWAGHCSEAAPASLLFEEPPAAGVTYRGVTFDQAELKLLAAEVTGQYKKVEQVWLLGNDFEKYASLTNRLPAGAKRYFGEIEAGGLPDLLKTLRREMHGAGHALVMDLRDGNGEDADAIWNHAVFMYKTVIVQERADDLKLVQLTTTLYANADAHEVHGLPGRVVGEPPNAYVEKNDTTEIRHLVLQARFDDQGEINRRSRETLWKDVKTGDGRSTFAPRFATLVSGLGDDPNPQTPHAGNPVVLRNHVLLLLKWRKP